MKHNTVISRILVLIFIALFVVYFSRHSEDFKSLQDLNPMLLILVGMGYVGNIFTSGLFNKLIIKPFGKHISYLESFRVGLLSSVGNYFGPLLGGTGLRAVYLKKKVGLKYTDFIATLYGYYVIAFFISALIGLFAMGLLWDQRQERGFIIISLFFTSVIVILTGIIFNNKIPSIGRLTKRNVDHKIVASLNKLSDSWHKIQTQSKLIRSLVKITFVNITLFVLINYVEFLLIGVHLRTGALLLYACLGIFSILISLTPGSLGIREAIYLFSAGVMGVSSSQVLAVALIDRAIQFIVMALGWIAITIARRWFKQDIDDRPKA